MEVFIGLVAAAVFIVVYLAWTDSRPRPRS